MGSLLQTTVTKLLAAQYLYKMVLSRNDEDSLIVFFSGFNQMFLLYLLINIVVALLFESEESGIVQPEDYDFELDTALAKSSGHAAMMTCLAFLCMAALTYVMLARVFAAARKNLDLSRWWNTASDTVPYSRYSGKI